MKFFLSILSAGLLVTGYLENSSEVAISGAILFLLAQGFYLYDIYLYSKKYTLNQEKEVANIKMNKLESITHFIHGAITIFGLIVLFSEKLIVAGAIIWFGAIFMYFLSGIIIEVITGIPLRFGYGGWQVRSKRRYRRS